MLQDVLARVQAEACEPFQASPEDDTEPLAEYVDFIVQAFGADPGHAADAFAGHEAFLRSVLALIKGEGGAVPQQGAGGSIASDMDVADLVHLLADASCALSRKVQAALLLQCNLWASGENPKKLLDSQAPVALLAAIEGNPEEDDLVVKCCKVLEALFSYKGVLPQVDAASRQVIRGAYLVAMGKAWHPASFLCGRTGQPITHQFYVVNHVPVLPEAVTDNEKQGLAAHAVKRVEPSEAEDPGAALAFIQQFMAEDGLRRLTTALATNLSAREDDYAALSGAKVLQALLQADDGFCDKLLELAKGLRTAGELAVVGCCCLLRGAATDALLRRGRSVLSTKLAQFDGSQSPTCKSKFSALSSRLNSLA
eukprot:EG_transcript_9582